MRKKTLVGILVTFFLRKASKLERTLMLTLAMMPVYCCAQPMDNSHKVDTLSFWERVSVRTNIPDWALMVPNIGVEYDIRNTNWNRWSAGLNIRWRPKGSNNIIKPFVFDLLEVTLEGRQYWRERKATAKGYLSPHHRWTDKLFSCRTMLPSHPNWIFYRGGYVGMAQYSTMFGDTGYQGTSYMAGFTWGFVRPFLAWKNGNSLDFEVGISAGLIMTSYDTYTHDEYNNCYPKTGHVDSKVLPMVRDIHAAVVYRFGKYPIQKKYRWRYDVDLTFHNKKDSLYRAMIDRRDMKYLNDSIYKRLSGEFRMLYDSCVIVRHIEDQQAIDAKAPARVVNTLKRQVEDSLIVVKLTKEKERNAKKIADQIQRDKDKKEEADKKLQDKMARDKRKATTDIKDVDDEYSVKQLRTNITAIRYQKAEAKMAEAEKKREEKLMQKARVAKQKEQAKVTRQRVAGQQRDAKAAARQKAKDATTQQRVQQHKQKVAQKAAQQTQKEKVREASKASKLEAEKAAIKAKIEVEKVR